MALLVWLPLNGNLNNQGLSNITVTNNGATVNSAGKIGSCYSFDGNAHYLQFDKSLADLYCGDFSWALWVKPTDDTRGILISEYSSTGSSNVALELLANRNIRVYWNGAPDWQSGQTITKNTWSHVAVTRSGNILKIYINGALVATKSDATLTNRTSSSKIRIGDDYRGGTSVSFMGYLNDVRIYNHCLSKKEVAEIAKGLVLHYTLDDEYVGNTINLLSGYDISWSALTCVTSATKTGDVYTVTIGNLTGNNTFANSRAKFPLAILENSAQYSFSFKYKVISGNGNIDINRCDWCDAAFSSKEIIPMGDCYYAKFVCPIKNYDSTYRFMDFYWTDANTVFEIWDVQLEKNSKPSPYVSSSRGLVTKYDGNVYVEPDGSKWARIVHHNNPAGGVFPSSSADWPSGVYVDANKWFDVYNTANQVTTYELMVKQKTTSDATETKYRWIQYKNPLTAVYADVAPSQVTRITTSGYTNGGFGGLYLFTQGNTRMVIANNTNGNWFGALGSWTAYNGGIPGYPNTNITSGYIDLYIRVDEILPKIYDCSGYGNHGVLYGNSLTVQTGSPRYSKCFLANTADTYSSIVAQDLKLPDGPTTLSFWSKPVVSAAEDTSKIDLSFSKIRYFTYLNYPYFIHDTNYHYKYTNFWSDGKWHYITCVYTGSALKLYIDSNLISMQTTTTTQNFNNNLNLQFRKNNLSDFRIYATALSEDDIKDLYHTAAFVDKEGNLHCYSGDEDTNTQPIIKKDGCAKTYNFIELGNDTKVLSDGSIWVRVLHHDNPASNLFTTSNCWKYDNGSTLFSALYLLKDTSWANSNGEYEFLVCEKLESSSTEAQYRWKQTNNPILSSTVSGYTLISGSPGKTIGIAYDGRDGYALLSNKATWWCACGSYGAYQGGIPGFGGVVKSGYINLYIRINDSKIKDASENIAIFYKDSILNNQLLEI